MELFIKQLECYATRHVARCRWHQYQYGWLSRALTKTHTHTHTLPKSVALDAFLAYILADAVICNARTQL